MASYYNLISHRNYPTRKKCLNEVFEEEGERERECVCVRERGGRGERMREKSLTYKKKGKRADFEIENDDIGLFLGAELLYDSLLPSVTDENEALCGGQ